MTAPKTVPGDTKFRTLANWLLRLWIKRGGPVGAYADLNRIAEHRLPSGAVLKGHVVVTAAVMDAWIEYPDGRRVQIKNEFFRTRNPATPSQTPENTANSTPARGTTE